MARSELWVRRRWASPPTWLPCPGAPHLLAAYVSLAPYEQMKNTYVGGVLKDADTVGWTRRQGADEATLNAISGNALDSQEFREKLDPYE